MEGCKRSLLAPCTDWGDGVCALLHNEGINNGLPDGLSTADWSGEETWYLESLIGNLKNCKCKKKINASIKAELERRKCAKK